MMISRASLLVSCVALFAAVSGVNAQNFPAEGPLSVSFTATQIPPAKPMAIGPGKEFVVLNMAMTASNDTGNPVLHKMGGRCQFARTVDTSAKTTEQHGFCTYADSDGDQIFEQCDFLPGAPNNCKLTGGTGKFEGLEASIVITAAPVKNNYDVLLRSSGRRKVPTKSSKKHSDESSPAQPHLAVWRDGIGPGPIVGAGLPGLMLASLCWLGWRRRRPSPSKK